MENNLTKISHLTIADLIEFAPFMKMSLRDAVPKVKEFLLKHNIATSDHKIVADVVRKVGLYE